MLSEAPTVSVAYLARLTTASGFLGYYNTGGIWVLLMYFLKEASASPQGCASLTRVMVLALAELKGLRLTLGRSNSIYLSPVLPAI